MNGRVFFFYGTLTLIVSCIFIHTGELFAESGIYTWKDSAGVTHYSSQAATKEAKQATLPEITKGEVKLTTKALISCDSRGGIDCQAGADTDGSVICYDGFKDSSMRYRLSCSSPKLEIAGISEQQPDGTFVVTLRNTKTVRARAVILTFKNSAGNLVPLIGPKEVDPRGTAEYVYNPAEGPESIRNDIGRMEKPDAGKIDISCGNC